MRMLKGKWFWIQNEENFESVGMFASKSGFHFMYFSGLVYQNTIGRRT